MSTDLVKIPQPENWIHYSSSSDEIVMETRYQQMAAGKNDISFFKPRGLWITPEYAAQNWFDWCMGEDFRKAELNFIHDVKIKPNANLLRLENVPDLDQFTKQYGYSLMAEHYTTELTKHSDYMRSRRDAIRWDTVAEKYDGILIPNYIWERRLYHGTEWYYAWDCACGCIWNSSAVESIKARSLESAGYVSRDFDVKVALATLHELQQEQAEDGV